MGRSSNVRHRNRSQAAREPRRRGGAHHCGLLLRRAGGRAREGVGSIHVDRRSAAIPESAVSSVHRSGGPARRLVVNAHRQDRPTRPARGNGHRMLVRAVRRDLVDTAVQRDAADLQRPALDATRRMGRLPPTGIAGDLDRRRHRLRRGDSRAAAPGPQLQYRRAVRARGRVSCWLSR